MQEGKPDRIADLLDEAASALEKAYNDGYNHGMFDKEVELLK